MFARILPKGLVGLVAMPPQQRSTERTRPGRWKRRLLRVMLGLVLGPFLLLGLVMVLVYLPPVQDRLRAEATGYLQEKIGTPVRLDHFALRYPAGIALEGLLLLDQKGDTLLHAGEVRTDLDLWALIDGRLTLNGTQLSHVRAVITQRADSTFNFTYIIRAFTGEPTRVREAVADSTAPMPFSMSGVLLQDISMDLLLASGLDMKLRLGGLRIDMNEMDAKALLFHAPLIAITDTRLDLRTTSDSPRSDTYPDLKNPLAGLDIALAQLALDHVAFTLMNTTTGDSLWLDLVKGEVAVDSLAFERQQLRFASIALEAVRFGTLTKGSAMPPDTTRAPTPAWLDQNDGFRFWMRGLDVGARALTITGGELQMHRSTLASGPKGFDPDHIVYKAIDLSAADVEVNDQRLGVAINALSATDAEGSSMLASLQLTATPASVRVQQGHLAVDGTEVHFTLSAEPGDLSTAYRTPKQVPLHARASASIHLAGLPGLFRKFNVPWPAQLDANEVWDTQLAYSGTAQRADTLRVDLVGDQGSIIHLRGDAQRMDQLPRTAFHADLQEVAMGQGMRTVLAAFLPASVPLPSHFSGRATVIGTSDGLNADIALKSDLGNITGTASATNMHGRMPDAVHVDLTINDLALRRFTGDTAIGLLSAHMLVDGNALNSPERSGNLEIVPSKLHYHGQDLSASRITASLLRDSVHAVVITDASDLAIALRTDVHWPVGSDTLSGAIDLNVDRLQLEALGWYPQPLGVQGRWHGTGTYSLNGFAGLDLKGDSVMIFNTKRSFTFEDFVVRGHVSTDSTRFLLDTDALLVDYSTNVPIDSLMPRAKETLLSFFRSDTSFIPCPGQRMDLRVELPRTEWLTAIVLPELRAIELKNFTGHYDSDADALDLNIDLPVLRYGELALLGMNVNANAQGRALNGDLRVDSARYSAFHVYGLSLEAASGSNSLHATLKTTREDGIPNYVVPVEFQRTEGDIVLHLADGLVLDTSAWNVDAQNSLRFTDEGPMAEHFTLSSGAQHAQLITSANATVVKLEQFNMGALLNLVSTKDSVDFVAGSLTGEVALPLNEHSPLSADLRIEGFALTGKPIGDLVIEARGTGAKAYNANARLENGTNELDAKLHYDGDQQPAAMDAEAKIGLADMSFLQPFAGGVLFEMSGGLNGNVTWQKLPAGNSINGSLTFTNAVVGVKQTGARYTLHDEHLVADATGLTLNDFTVLDSLGNAFVLDGKVLTTDLINMRFDLALRTDSFQLVNSAPTKDALFYGDLFASADVRITGTDKAPVVKGDLGILAGTDLSVVLPGSTVKLIGSEGIVEFTTDLYGTDTLLVATDQERLRDSLRAQLPKVDMDLRIRVDDRAAFAIVLDPTTGDQATFQGTGDLRFRYNADEEMRLSGPFTVSKGGYTLEFYGLVKKRFELVPGSTVVWDGDPIGAQMDIKARYTSETAAYPLEPVCIIELRA
ncbi:MAG: translocation/assembly module TamB domain-containing protein [Flavobacteriales bacterium]|nr:translocation/assembly module TamB domain-containing protein [Flavobacteriales bacterium]